MNTLAWTVSLIMLFICGNMCSDQVWLVWPEFWPISILLSSGISDFTEVVNFRLNRLPWLVSQFCRFSQLHMLYEGTNSQSSNLTNFFLVGKLVYFGSQRLKKFMSAWCDWSSMSDSYVHFFFLTLVTYNGYQKYSKLFCLTIYPNLGLSDLSDAQNRPNFSDQNLHQKIECNSCRRPKLSASETT